MDESLKTLLDRRGYENKGCVCRRSLKPVLFVREFHLLRGSIRLYRYGERETHLPTATWEVEMKAITQVAGLTIPCYLHLYSKSYLSDAGLVENLTAIETRCLEVLRVLRSES